MEALRKIRSKYVVLPMENIDTDQIIPARFLKITTKTGLGKNVFSDWRYDTSGKPKPEFILNRPEAAGCQVLVAGDNFGCGSSREHAPWALVDFGVRAVISTSIADIFRNNALKNGLLPVVVDEAVHNKLLAGAAGAGGQGGSGNAVRSGLGAASVSHTEVTIDLETRELELADGTRATFAVEPFARYLLLNGLDELDFLLSQDAAISRFEQVHPSNLFSAMGGA